MGRICVNRKSQWGVLLLASNVGDLARNARTDEMIALIYECEVAGALAIHRVSARHSDIQCRCSGLCGLQLCATRRYCQGSICSYTETYKLFDRVESSVDRSEP